MKKYILKSVLMVAVGLAATMNSVMAGQYPDSTIWLNPGNIESFIGTNLFPGVDVLKTAINFEGTYAYTAIAYEASATNTLKEVKKDDVTFGTNDTSNWGSWDTVDFNENGNLKFYTDGKKVAYLDQYFLNTNDANYFKIYELGSDSLTLGYLSNPITLRKGDYIVGFNDSKSTDSDFDDIIIAMTRNPSTPVPEPSTMLLLGAGIAGLAAVVRKYKK